MEGQRNHHLDAEMASHQQQQTHCSDEKSIGDKPAVGNRSVKSSTASTGSNNPNSKDSDMDTKQRPDEKDRHHDCAGGDILANAIAKVQTGASAGLRNVRSLDESLGAQKTRGNGASPFSFGHEGGTAAPAAMTPSSVLCSSSGTTTSTGMLVENEEIGVSGESFMTNIIDGDDDDTDDEDYDSDAECSFISWFLGLPGHDFFVRIPGEYIADDFNLAELPYDFDDLDDAIDLALLDDLPSAELLNANPRLVAEARILYQLVHQRYIQSRAGMSEMLAKYKNDAFGTCPRYYCGGESVLPLGQSSRPGKSTVKLYCPRCQDIYQPPTYRHNKLDGVGFGPTFAHLLIRTHLADTMITGSAGGIGDVLNAAAKGGSSTANARGPAIILPSTHSLVRSVGTAAVPLTRSQMESSWDVYEPRIFGFRLHQSNPAAPRMKWLRQKPQDFL